MTPRLERAIEKAIGAFPAPFRPMIAPALRELVLAILDACRTAPPC
jgi:hypothetical protein